MNKRKLMRITSVFFIMMLCFTVLSRAANQAGTAVVEVAPPENKMITHEVKATGKITQNQELAVTTEPDQRVKAVYVSEGELVDKGDLLFEIDLDLLEEKILEQQQEMEKQSLQVKDAKSQKDVSAQQKASQQAQAAEQYSLAVQSANVQLTRAKEELAQAKKELKDFREGSGLTQGDSSVEEALTKACEEKTDAYIAAEQELAQLEWEIENAVYTALQEAQSGASLVRKESVYTQAADVEKMAEGNAGISSDSDVLEVSEEISLDSDVLEVSEETGLDNEVQEVSEDLILGYEVVEENQDIILDYNIEETHADSDATQPEVIQTEAPVSDATQPEVIQTEAPVSDATQPEVIQTEAPISEPSQPESTQPQLSQADLDQIEQSIRDSYSTELAAAKQKVTDAQQEKTDAETALAEYQQEHRAATSEEAAQQEKQLIEKVEAARQAYEDAALAANKAAVTSGRAVQQAGIPNASDSSDRMNEITYEQMELTLKKLEHLKEENGQIRAPADGVITKIYIMTGEKTTDTTAILMADLSKGLCFQAEITKDQAQYIGTGDLVTLTGNDKKQKLEELPVESVAAEEADSSVYHVTVQLGTSDENVFPIGAASTMEFSRKSEAYPLCVPLSVLHLDEKNQPYVLVLQEYESIMGTELRARKVGVTVLEKNESYAALAEETLTSQQEVIIQSDKAVDDGSRVRVQG